MARILNNILVTGGAGFIGCNFIHMLLKNSKDFTGKIVNLDALTYAGCKESLKSIEDEFGGSRYFFEESDVCDSEAAHRIFKKYNIDTVVHFAAESHVDRSITNPKKFMETNILGAWNLLETACDFWKDSSGRFKDGVLFHHISTDEVYGSLGETGFFTETTPYNPRSPYSASKASSDHIAMSYFHTYGLPVTLSNCSNNYGPYQFPEKLIPLMILNILEKKPLPVYGDGMNIRDWIFVKDHNEAVWEILKNGKAGEKYNIGGECEIENIRLVNILIETAAKKTGANIEEIKKTITYVKDRPGHDRRYAIDCSKLKKELNWKQKTPFEKGVEETVEWYLLNKPWINKIRERSAL
ncbi:MAG: dTDP-glucose 4,6-dehydratase [Spirochaetaceae bacterium]|jgi:dTDP-glucose 4,6-dehydratase|nr:dTDP-glucose 4,6-dehydratase [Spirochaetaceae bacterium]